MRIEILEVLSRFRNVRADTLRIQTISCSLTEQSPLSTAREPRRIAPESGHLSGWSTLLDSFPSRVRRARSLAVAILSLAALLFGCQRVGTSRIPARGRSPLAHASWGKPGRDSARADLQGRGLRLEFAAHPRDVFRDLEAETLARPTPRGLLTLGEIAYRIGRRSTSIAARESLEWYRDASAYASLVVADPALGPEAICSA